jgi:hypothetical protein
LRSMRAIARSAVLVCVVAAFASADSHDDVMEVVTSMAGALAEVADTRAGVVRGNVPKFMAAISKDMPDYDTLKSNVTALVNEGEISSSIQPVSEDGDDRARTIELDWAMEVRSLEQDGPIVQRREVVHCELRKENKHWKIVAIKPLDFFGPAKPGQ